jgi:hypothetical protein
MEQHPAKSPPEQITLPVQTRNAKKNDGREVGFSSAGILSAFLSLPLILLHPAQFAADRLCS